MNDNNKNDGAETCDVVVTRVLDAPVEEVWNAWSDPAYVTRWWGPTGFTSPSAEMDFRVGGTSLVCMRVPAEYGAQDMYHTWTYTRIEPHEQIELDPQDRRGWLREAGKKDRRRLLRFLDGHAATMPRTMLHYAIEHLDEEQRAHYLSMKKGPEAGQDQGGDRS